MKSTPKHELKHWGKFREKHLMELLNEENDILLISIVHEVSDSGITQIGDVR